MKRQKHSHLLSIANGIFFFGLSLLLLLTLLGMSGDRPVWLGLFAHFKLQYALALIPFCVWYLFRGKWLWFMLGLAAFLINFPVKPLVFSANINTSYSEKVYSLLSHNVLAFNVFHEKVKTYLEEEDPDFILLHEYTPGLHRSLAPLWEKYPYRRALPRYGFTGSLLASKYPIKRPEAIWFGPMDVPSLTAVVSLPEGEIRVVGIHPPSPPNARDIHYRNTFMDSLTRQIKGPWAVEDLPILLAGDFNNTPYHPRFQNFLRESGLKDSRLGIGNQASFPTHLGKLGIPLDHILISSDIQVQSRKTGPGCGSDHLPLHLEFSLLSE